MGIAASRLNLDLLPCGDKGRKTTFTFAIHIDRAIVWPVPGEEEAYLEIQVDDLLAHLTDFWKPLILRQVYPIDVAPLRPSDLRRQGEHRWAALPAEIVDVEEDAVARFEEAHDLSRAFAGVYGLPAFWILRSGEQFILETAGKTHRLPFADVRDTLAAIGDSICEHLKKSDALRWESAIAAWFQRDEGDATSLLAWSTGLDRSLAETLIQEGALSAPRSFEDLANDGDELRIAARMAGALPPDQIRGVISLARQFGGRDAGPLRDLSKACLEFITREFGRAPPFQQGEAAARFVRERLEMTSDRRLDVFEIARSLEVDVRHSSVEPPTLDGLAIWGPCFGPGVFLNEASSRILGQGNLGVPASLGARVTLAHELCHLLLDGTHALSAVEVLKARMPSGVEQRAKSFAGEFLLPTRVAGRHWQDAGRPGNRIDLELLVDSLVESYGVTRSVAAWKVEHAARAYHADLGAILDAIAPWR